LGHVHGCGVQTNGSIACWGCNGGPEINMGQCENHPGNYNHIGAGTAHSCAMNDTTIDCWGCGDGTWQFDGGQCDGVSLEDIAN
jgi:hypothetical protein